MSFFFSAKLFFCEGEFRAGEERQPDVHGK